MIKPLIFIKQAPKVATPQDMAALESKLGVKLPPTFYEFCFRWNGGYASRENEIYAVPSSYTEFYKNMYGARKTDSAYVEVDIFLGATEDFKQCNLLKEYYLYRGAERGFIPITNNLEGNRAVLRADSPMGLVYWIDSDTWERPEDDSQEARPILMPIADNLESFYNGLMADPARDD